MSKSEARDNELRASIKANNALKDKYIRVKQDISNNDLDTKVDLTSLNDFISEGQEVLNYLNDNDGYSYLSTLKTKLTADLKTLRNYRNFIRDSSTSFVNLYNTLDTKISSLESTINADVAEYDEGHSFPERWFDDI